MNEFDKKIIKAIKVIEDAAGMIEDNPEVEELLSEGNFNTEFPFVAVMEYIAEVKNLK